METMTLGDGFARRVRRRQDRDVSSVFDTQRQRLRRDLRHAFHHLQRRRRLRFNGAEQRKIAVVRERDGCRVGERNGDGRGKFFARRGLVGLTSHDVAVLEEAISNADSGARLDGSQTNISNGKGEEDATSIAADGASGGLEENPSAEREGGLEEGSFQSLPTANGREKADSNADGCDEKTPTQRAFLDISIDGEPAGRIVIGLYGSDDDTRQLRFHPHCVEMGSGGDDRGGAASRWVRAGDGFARNFHAVCQ